MSNPFATATPGTGQANPFANAQTAPPQTANPFGNAPAANGAPQFQAPAANTAPPAGDPFGTPPPVPEVEGLSKSDAEKGTTVILRIKAVERVTSKFSDQKTGQFEQQDRLTVDVTVVTGEKAGRTYTDQWIFWSRVIGQFRECVGNGQPYLVTLTMDGRAVTTAPVTDPAVRAHAATLL